jgi:hypothetical protein
VKDLSDNDRFRPAPSPASDRYDGRENTSRRRQVATLLRQGRTVSQIAKQLGVSVPTVCHHARKVGHPPNERFLRRYDWTSVQLYHDAGHSAAECRARFGFSKASWAQAVQRGALVPRPRAIPIESLLVAGPKRNRTHIKLRLLGSGLKEARCEACGVAEWLGRPLSLELHHANGDGLDNRLENLSLLCPNCHSQTDTWGGKNKGGKAGTAS